MMPPDWGRLFDDATLAARALADRVSFVGRPTLRLGVTGLARAGKTIFITALVQALMRGEKLPVFEVAASGRLRRAVIEPQPNDELPRFAVEDHLKALAERREWPESTRRIAELRVAVEYESAKGGGPATLLVDIVDYPGEWLLDLGLMETDYRGFCSETLDAALSPARRALSGPFLEALAAADPSAPAAEALAEHLSDLFKQYLAACRTEPYALSTLPPGRFLLPGDMEGSPALTFAPLGLKPDEPIVPGSLAAMMERRYEAYRTHVVRPFFRDHFARLDRQIVLVDVLSALDAGPDALHDLENALARVLLVFRAGRNSWLSSWFSPRVDRVLFAATKADHLHHSQHDRLEAILRLILDRAMRRVESTGAKVSVAALASVRATREGQVKDGNETLPAIIGTPQKGETIGGKVFDGIKEVAIFTGELPADPKEALAGGLNLRFPRVLPPLIPRTTDGRFAALPHIRLDRALQFLLGDRLS